MNIQKHILQSYNRKDTLLVISTYPKKGEIYSKDVDAVAPYTKNTILGIKKLNPSRKIVVLAPVVSQMDKYTSYVDDGVLVIRCFKRNHPLSFANIFKVVQQFNTIDTLLVEFEFSSFGDIKTTLSLPILLSTLAAVGKHVTLVLHQVVLDLATLSGHIGVAGIKTKVMSMFLRHYYKILCAAVRNIIVLEDEIKKRLSTLVNPEKVHVSYHGVDVTNTVKDMSQKKARKMLGIHKNEFVILYFGYITWYKGADFLAKAFQTQKQIGGKKIRVILGGGPSATQKHKKHYQKFFNKVQNLVKNNKQVTLTGFVKEEELATYMSAADLVVYPYRTFMSSSGALATAFAFEKPFLVSSKLRAYFESRDIQKLLVESGLTFEDISFRLRNKSLLQAVKKVQQKERAKKLSRLSKAIKKERDFTVLAKCYSDVMTSEKRFTFPVAPLQLSYGEK